MLTNFFGGIFFFFPKWLTWAVLLRILLWASFLLFVQWGGVFLRGGGFWVFLVWAKDTGKLFFSIHKTNLRPPFIGSVEWSRIDILNVEVKILVKPRYCLEIFFPSFSIRGLKKCYHRHNWEIKYIINIFSNIFLRQQSNFYEWDDVLACSKFA